MSQDKKGRDRSRPLLFLFVMPGLVPGIHVLAKKKVVDGRAFAAPKGALAPQAGQARP
jgi:hypothetical protein